MNILKKIPSVFLFVLLALVYMTCGYVIGYHTGYKAGQDDYIIYINKIFDNVKSQDWDKIEEKSPEKK